MKALSIRQPWAWLIAGGYKDVENRRWRTLYRGPLLIHASSFSRAGYFYAACWAASYDPCCAPEIPKYRQVHRGGIIAVADLVDVVTASDSRWFEGPWGFVLANVRRGPFVPLSGRQNIFDVPDDLVAAYVELARAPAEVA